MPGVGAVAPGHHDAGQMIGCRAAEERDERQALAVRRPGGLVGAVLHGAIERGGDVQVSVIPDAKARTLKPQIRSRVEPGSTLYTDSAPAYFGLDQDYDHDTVDHAFEYVRGHVHTNTMENFWSLLKRGLRGTYISVEPFHLFRYLDEQVYRFNRRKANDFERFAWVLGAVAGRRLTWATLTGRA